MAKPSIHANVAKPSIPSAKTSAPKEEIASEMGAAVVAGEEITPEVDAAPARSGRRGGRLIVDTAAPPPANRGKELPSLFPAFYFKGSVYLSCCPFC